MADIIKNDTDGTFIEQNCTIELEGKSFEMGGSWLCKRVDNGKMGGILYVYPKESAVGTWDGKTKIPAVFGSIFRSNMGDRRRHVWFEYQGKKFIGLQCSIDWQDIVKVREIS